MNTIIPILKKVSRASTDIKLVDNETKIKLLSIIASTLKENISLIITENKKDLILMDDHNPKKDRLLLNEERILNLANSVLDVAKLPDPTGQLISEHVLDNGLQIKKVTTSLGVVGVIYESRPNVTVDVAALCFKSGNACVLRGGTDAKHTNSCLVNIIKQAITEIGISTDIIELLPTDRKFVTEMLNATGLIDIIIPRGSNELIQFVRTNATIPVIETGAGVCHTYIEKTANLNDAINIVINAKTSRPSVCNALDTIILDENISVDFIKGIADKFISFNVEIFADEQSYQLLKAIKYPFLSLANESDFGREFLDFKCSLRIVKNFGEAIDHIAKYSSKHSEAIVTQNMELAERFLNEIDAAAVYLNASTRFTDGSVFGLGAEIGVSTQKLHARGPFALEKLVTEKWVIRGNGQIR